MTAANIARAVSERQVSAREVMQQTMRRIDERDSKYNAFTHLVADRAMLRAETIDRMVAAGENPGPLAAVPFAAKELFDVEGRVTRAGARVTADDPAAIADADAISAIESTGAVLVGTTNMDEFAYGFVTENAHNGATRNPHDVNRIAGGSSGGSAAAVAGRLVPLALGSDTNGSIRVPAVLCGIFGLRPTFDTISVRGAFPLSRSLDTVGPFALTADDLRQTFRSLRPRDLSSGNKARTNVRCARLGGYFLAGLSDEARTAFERVCGALDVRDELVLPSAVFAREAAFIITSPEGGSLHLPRLLSSGRDYDPATRDRFTAGALTPAAWYLRARKFRAAIRHDLAVAFRDFDVLVAPVVPHAATEIGRKTIDIDGVESDIRANLGVFTQPLSLAGVPALAVPVIGSGPMPCGAQLVGRPHDEMLLLDLAERLEQSGAIGSGDDPYNDLVAAGSS